MGGCWFHPIVKGRTYPDTYDPEKAYIKTPRLKMNRTNMMIILFRKTYFEKLLVCEEDAWKYEVESNVRSILAGYDVIHYNINLSKPIFKYFNKHRDGVGITSRKWLDKTHEIFEQNGISDVNYSNLGILDSNESCKDPTDKRCSNKSKKLSVNDFVFYYIKRPIRNSSAVRILKSVRYYVSYYLYYGK